MVLPGRPSLLRPCRWVLRAPGRRAGFEDVPVCAAARGQADGQGILLGGGRGPADDLAVRTKGKQFQTTGPGAQGDCAGHGFGQEWEMLGWRSGRSLPMSVAGLGRTCPTAVTRMNRDDASGWSSMLESATTALVVLNWKVASLRARVLPPIQPLTAWVLGVLIVWIPRSSSASAHRCPTAPTSAPRGCGRGPGRSDRTSPEISLGFSQGSSLTAGIAMVSRLCSTRSGWWRCYARVQHRAEELRRTSFRVYVVRAGLMCPRRNAIAAAGITPVIAGS